MRLIRQEEVAPDGQAVDKTVQLTHHPVAQHGVHLAHNAGFLPAHAVAHQFLPVVERRQAHHGALFPVLLVNRLEIGVVHKIKDIASLRPGAVNRVLPAAVGNGRALFPHDLPEGFGIDVFEHIFPHKIPAAAERGRKRLVGPYDIPGRSHHGHRQGKFLQGVFLRRQNLLGGFHRGGHIPPEQEIRGGYRQNGQTGYRHLHRKGNFIVPVGDQRHDQHGRRHQIKQGGNRPDPPAPQSPHLSSLLSL